jgi:outer membrane lipoprotein-sorting protein
MTNFEDEQFGRRLSRTSIDDAPRDEHRGQLRQQSLAAFDDAQSPVAWKTVSWKTSLRHSLSDWRTIMSRPFPRVAASLLVIVAVVLGVALFSSNNSNTAWADMAETILNTKSAKFKVAVTIKDQQPMVFDAMLLEPNLVRQEMPGGMVMISDWNAGKMVNLDPKAKVATIVTMTDRPKDAPSQSFLQPIKELLLDEKSNPEVKRESLGEKTIDSHRAVGFRIVSPLMTMSIWGDPVSGLPYRIETSMKMMPNVKSVMSDFDLNVELDESLFSVVPPADYKVMEMSVSAAIPAEKDLIAALRTYSDQVDGSFPDALDMKSWMGPLYKSLGTDIGEGGATPPMPSEKQMKKLADVTSNLTRGCGFALALPEQTEATYAGKGVQRDAVDTPIFWYKPEGAEKYRVIYADLSVKEVAAAPEAENARPLSKTESKSSD